MKRNLIVGIGIGLMLLSACNNTSETIPNNASKNSEIDQYLNKELVKISGKTYSTDDILYSEVGENYNYLVNNFVRKQIIKEALKPYKREIDKEVEESKKLIEQQEDKPDMKISKEHEDNIRNSIEQKYLVKAFSNEIKDTELNELYEKEKSFIQYQIIEIDDPKKLDQYKQTIKEKGFKNGLASYYVSGNKGEIIMETNTELKENMMEYSEDKNVLVYSENEQTVELSEIKERLMITIIMNKLNDQTFMDNKIKEYKVEYLYNNHQELGGVTPILK